MGVDTEKVIFKGMMDGTGEDKFSYEKIRFCTQQAADDGLQYFCADSCCIDKSSSAELQEAMNSMFLWCKNAAKCYFYLSEVSKRQRKGSGKQAIGSANVLGNQLLGQVDGSPAHSKNFLPRVQIRLDFLLRRRAFRG